MTSADPSFLPMFYDFDIVIRAGTTEASPTTEILRLTYGIIHYVAIEMPPGCRGLVYCRIRRWESQVWPLNRGGYFRTEGPPIIFEERYPLLSRPYTLKFEGWSPNAGLDHSVFVRLGLLPPESFPEFYMQLTTEEKLALAFQPVAEEEVE